jgi:hypothetical protein
MRERVPVPSLIRRHVAASVCAGLLTLGLVPSIVWALLPAHDPPGHRVSAPDPRYASQSGSPHKARESHVRTRGDEEVDSAVETCGGMGLAPLARKYGVAPDPVLVAQRFAKGYELALQRRVYRGCLEGLRHGG